MRSKIEILSLHLKPMKTIYPISKIILFFCALIFLTSCRKDQSGPTKVSGRVLFENNTSNHPVGVSKVFLHRLDPSCFSCGGAGIIDTFYSNTDGSYSFTFNADENYGYSVSAWNSSCFENYRDISIEKGEKNKVDITLSPIGYLRLFIKNINPENESDYIGVSNTYENGGVYYFLGTTVDTTVIDIIRGNRENRVIWFVERNGEKRSYSDNIYCPAFDTVEYTIEY